MSDSCGCHFLGRSHGYDGAAIATTFGAHIYDIVGGLDDVEVVLDDNDGISAVHQSLEHAEQHADVLKVKARCRFV